MNSAAYAARKRAWVEEQLERAPKLSAAQQHAIRRAFAEPVAKTDTRAAA
ncbi:hypothetical protein [Nocardia sp. NPDC059239]